MSNQLKPCPFCGAADALWARESYSPVKVLQTEEVGVLKVVGEKIYQGHLVECVSCGARGPHEYKKPMQNMQEAQDLWNTRPREDQLQAQVDALVEYVRAKEAIAFELGNEFNTGTAYGDHARAYQKCRALGLEV